MSELVQMRVTVDDVERLSIDLSQAENDPQEVSLLEEWGSHDQMHEASEKYGDQFNEAAGTVGKDWETRVWHKL